MKTPIPSSPVQAQRGTDERDQVIADLREHWPHDVEVRVAADMLRADAETIRSLEAKLSGADRMPDFERLHAVELSAVNTGKIADYYTTQIRALERAMEQQLRASDEEIAGLRAALRGMLNRTKNIGQSKFPSKAHYEAFIDAYFTADAALQENPK